MSWEEIGEQCGLDVHQKNICAALHCLGYFKRVPHKKHDLIPELLIILLMSNLSRFAVSPVNQQKRVEWCQAHLHWTYDDWSHVIWTDESSFSTAGYHHRPWVIRKAGEEYLEDTVDTTYHSGR